MSVEKAGYRYNNRILIRMKYHNLINISNQLIARKEGLIFFFFSFSNALEAISKEPVIFNSTNES